MEDIKSNFGKLDAVVNCAGIAFAIRMYNPNKRTMADMDRYKKTFDVSNAFNVVYSVCFQVNVLGTINVIRQSVHLMMDKNIAEDEERGVVINTSSVAAFDGQIGQVIFMKAFFGTILIFQTAYSASKGAIHSMTLPLARELGNSGIRVNTIAPGVFETPLLTSLPPKVQKFLSNLTAYPNRLGYPEEFAELVQHIILNKYLNAETIRMDAGLRMPA